MILTAHQPCYLPWLGFFNKVALSDVFCFFDIVQYQRKDFNNRNKIVYNNEIKWLTIPVNDSGRFNTQISQIEISGQNWKKKHLKTIYFAYKKTKFFENYYSSLKKIIEQDFKHLVDLNFELIIFFLECLKIKTKVLKASEYNFSGTKSELVLDMCKKLNAKTYIFGSQGKNYANKKDFEKNNIKILFQEYKHPNYTQNSKKFISNLSILDLLFNEGEKSKEILMQNNNKVF